MRVNKLLGVIFIVAQASCNSRNEDSKQKDIILYNKLSVSVPHSYSLVEKVGLDSYVFEIVGPDGVVLKGDIGNFEINELNLPITVFDINDKDSLLRRMGKYYDSNIVFFSKTPEQDIGQNIFSKNYFFYDTINGIIVKIIKPKKLSQGLIGLYIPDFEGSKKFTLYAQNLNSTQQEIVTRIFYSIKRL